MPLIPIIWPAPSNIIAFTTTRADGYSSPPFDANNLAYHVGDDKNCVYKNRLQLAQYLPKNAAIHWLEQTHSTDCIIVDNTENRNADAMITRNPNHFLAILTADCLPIILTHKDGLEIANIHAGWKGLVGGIIQNTLSKLSFPPEEYYAYLGPCICEKCYEVGHEIPEQLINCQPDFSSITHWYTKKTDTLENKYLLNLRSIARTILEKHKIQNVTTSTLCTFEEEQRLFSYRRENKTGRIATIIGINTQRQTT